jgi:signal peptidase I
MSPTLKSNDMVAVDMRAYRSANPQRWEVVLFHPPPSTMVPNQFWIMRIVGLPNEVLELKAEGIYVDGKPLPVPPQLVNIRHLPANPEVLRSTISHPYKIPEGCFFLCGDNTTNALDSRYWGPLPKGNILGKATHVNGAILTVNTNPTLP